MREYGSGSVIKLNAGKSNESRYWYILYRKDGRQIRESSKSESKMEAEQLLQRRMGEAGLGLIPAQDVKAVKYENVRDSYVSESENQRRSDPQRCGLQHLDKFFSGMSVLRITPDMIRQFIAARRKARASDPTIRRNLVLLRAMLNQARKEGKIRFADVPHFPMPKDSAPAGQYLAPDVFARLLPTLPENLQPFFQFLYGTGCRLGAAQQITWDMVSPDGAVIKLPGEIVKSRTPLTIVLDGPMLQPIAAMLRKSFRTDGPVFDTTNFRMEWNKACAKLKLGTFDPVTRKRTGLRIHDLRCSAAVNMIDAGLSEDVVMKIGGWKTHSMLSRYNVLDAKRLRAAMTQAGNHVAARM